MLCLFSTSTIILSVGTSRRALYINYSVMRWQNIVPLSGWPKENIFLHKRCISTTKLIKKPSVYKYIEGFSC